jgi:hypothetical protein
MYSSCHRIAYSIVNFKGLTRGIGTVNKSGDKKREQNA